jgi:hypothetical protein
MLDHNTALASSLQGFIPSESIEHLSASHIVEVQRVVPCPKCQAPICVAQLNGCPFLRAYDATPNADWSVWTTDLLFDAHECPIYPPWTDKDWDDAFPGYGKLMKRSLCRM